MNADTRYPIPHAHEIFVRKQAESIRHPPWSSRREARAHLRGPTAIELRDDPQRAERADGRIVGAVTRELDVEMDLVGFGGDDVAEVPRAVVPVLPRARVEVL